MTKSEIFAVYVAAFEKAYFDDDWSRVEPLFTEDSSYVVDLAPPMGGRLEGRRAVMVWFKAVLDGFDRRFDRREFTILEGPFEEGDRLRFVGCVTYFARGMEELDMPFEEILFFEGTRIRRIEDHYDPAVMERAEAFLKKHGDRLGIPHR